MYLRWKRMERPLVGRGRKERNSEDRCTAVNECFRLERNFPREKKIFKTFFTFREGKEKGRKKEKDSCPVVSVSIFHPPPPRLFINFHRDSARTIISIVPRAASFRRVVERNDVSVTGLDKVEKDDRTGDGRPSCDACAGLLVRDLGHSRASHDRELG